MENQRKMEQLEDVPVTNWSIEELAFHHEAMSQMAGFLNSEGVSFHHTIINEIERRGGLNNRKET